MLFEISSKPNALPAINSWNQKKEIPGLPEISF
jgi:hypothetical protein